MIQLTASPTPGPFDPARPAGTLLSMTSDFALALADLAVTAAPAIAPQPAEEAGPAGAGLVVALRQTAAADGNTLPPARPAAKPAARPLLKLELPVKLELADRSIAPAHVIAGVTMRPAAAAPAVGEPIEMEAHPTRARKPARRPDEPMVRPASATPSAPLPMALPDVVNSPPLPTSTPVPPDDPQIAPERAIRSVDADGPGTIGPTLPMSVSVAAPVAVSPPAPASSPAPRLRAAEKSAAPAPMVSAPVPGGEGQQARPTEQLPPNLPPSITAEPGRNAANPGPIIAAPTPTAATPTRGDSAPAPTARSRNAPAQARAELPSLPPELPKCVPEAGSSPAASSADRDAFIAPPGDALDPVALPDPAAAAQAAQPVAEPAPPTLRKIANVRRVAADAEAPLAATPVGIAAPEQRSAPNAAARLSNILPIPLPRTANAAAPRPAPAVVGEDGAAVTAPIAPTPPVATDRTAASPANPAPPAPREVAPTAGRAQPVAAPAVAATLVRAADPALRATPAPVVAPPRRAGSSMAGEDVIVPAVAAPTRASPFAAPVDALPPMPAPALTGGPSPQPTPAVPAQPAAPYATASTPPVEPARTARITRTAPLSVTAPPAAPLGSPSAVIAAVAPPPIGTQLLGAVSASPNSPLPLAAAVISSPGPQPEAAAASHSAGVPIADSKPRQPATVMPVAVDPLPRQPAAQAFAAAMFAAEHAPARAGDLGSDLSSAFPITALITSAPSPLPAPADARAPVLDLRGNEWIGEMIETIEQLRDAAGPASAGTTETRLRLAPDALGSVDVAIRQEGEQLSVRITAETQAARTILADAAPKLAELAEARGLKLGSSPTEHSSGGGLADRQPRQQQQSNQPTRPASAFRAEDAHASPALTRIA